MAYSSRPLDHKIPASFSSEISDAISQFCHKEWLHKHCLDEKKLLYHYTDLHGLKGIINERGLWLTHISNLNDPTEIKYGQRLVIEALEKKILDEDNGNFRLFLNSIKSSVKYFVNSPIEPFLASFCESDNLLSQWRAYSKNGGGFSIGFDINDHCRISFDREDLKNCSIPQLRKVIYDPDEQSEIIDKCIEIIFKGFKSWYKQQEFGPHNKSGDQIVVSGEHASTIFLDLILSYKHPAFNEEKEWRLIEVALSYEGSEKLKFRENKNNLIPYIKSLVYNKKGDIYDIPIKSVRLGPSLDHESQRSAIDLYLKNAASLNNDMNINIPEHIRVKGADFELR